MEHQLHIHQHAAAEAHHQGYHDPERLPTHQFADSHHGHEDHYMHHDDPHHAYEGHYIHHDEHDPWHASHSHLVKTIPDHPYMHYTLTHPISEKDSKTTTQQPAQQPTSKP